MKQTIIRENKDLRSKKLHLPFISIFIALILIAIFTHWIFTFLGIIIAGFIFYYYLFPVFKYGIYIDEQSITMISEHGTTCLQWDNIVELTHQIRIKYHVLSLKEADKTLHISLEKYHPEKLIREVLKYVPKDKIETDSLKNLDQFYYYGKTIERK